MLQTVVLDPVLLIALRRESRLESLTSKKDARFVICDHFSDQEFLPGEVEQILNAVNQEGIGILSVVAVDTVDLLHLRGRLTFSKVAILATTRSHNGLFASNCYVFRRFACEVLSDKRVMSREELHRRYMAA